MKRVKFIYNPKAGEGRVPYMLDDIVKLYAEKELAIVPHRLSFSENEAHNIVSDLDDSYHHVLISGGDGTVNYVVNILKKADVDIPIALLPGGTANDFTNLIGMPLNIIDACKAILNGEQQYLDLGKVNDRYFINIFSCGLMTEVSQRTPTALKNTLGKVAYYLSGLGELRRFRIMDLVLESEHGEYDGKTLILFVFNGRTAGGFEVAFNSKLNDGLLEVLLVKGDNPRQAVHTLAHYFSGRMERDGYPSGVVYFQTDRLTVESETNESTDIDGQEGPGFPLEITCEHKALKIIVPKQRERS